MKRITLVVLIALVISLVAIPAHAETVTNPLHIWGDVNQDTYVNYWDCFLIVGMSYGWITPTFQGDLNSDGRVTMTDANLLWNYLRGY